VIQRLLEVLIISFIFSHDANRSRAWFEKGKFSQDKLSVIFYVSRPMLCNMEVPVQKQQHKLATKNSLFRGKICIFFVKRALTRKYVVHVTPHRSM
jgi:hypothetical protein